MSGRRDTPHRSERALIAAAMRFVRNWENTDIVWLRLDDDYRAMAKAAAAVQKARKRNGR